MSYIEQLFDGQEARASQQSSVKFKIVTNKGELSSDNSNLFITGMDGASIPDDNFDFAYYPALTSYGPKNPGVYGQRSLSVTFEDFDAGGKGSKQAYTYALNYMSFLNGGSEIEFHVIIDGTDKYVQGWISGVDFPYFEEGFSLTLNILCADPYWYEDAKYSNTRDKGARHGAIFFRNGEIPIPSPFSVLIESNDSTFVNDRDFYISDNSGVVVQIRSTASKKIEYKFVRGEFKILYDDSEQPISIIKSPFDYPYLYTENNTGYISTSNIAPTFGYYYEFTLHKRSLSLI